MHRFLGYLAYIIILGISTSWILRYGAIMKMEIGSSANPYPYQIFLTFYPIIVGVLIGTLHFISTLKIHGRLIVDWVKLCVVGLPSLLFGITPLTYFTEFTKYTWWIFSLDTYGQLFTISGIVFGYTLITSFKKIPTSVDNNSFFS